MGLWDRIFKKEPAPAPAKREFVTQAYTSQEEAPAQSKAEYRGTNLERVSMANLELQYARDPISFNGSNIISSLIGAEGYILNCISDKDKKTGQNFMDQIKFNNLIHQIGLHLCIYGNAWFEKLFNKARNNLSGLRIIDPKSMDFLRVDIQGKQVIDLDKWGNPKGYVQHPLDWDGTLNAGVEFAPENIMHLTMRQISDSLIGVGVLEPISKITWEKLNIEEALAQALWRLGFPLLVQSVGDIDHEPDGNTVKESGRAIQRVYNESVITLPYYRQLKIIESNVSQLRSNLDYYIEQQCAGIGLPKALVSGIGDSTNYSTLNTMTSMTATHINSIHRSIAESMNKEAFGTMLEIGQISNPIEQVFNPIEMNESYDKLGIIGTLVQQGVVTPTADLEAWILKNLELPENKEGFAPAPPKQQVAYALGLEMAKDMKGGKSPGHY